MVSVVWRAGGDDFDVDAFLREFPFETDKVWRKGDAKKGGCTCIHSGVNIFIAESDSRSEIQKLVLNSLVRLKSHFLRVEEFGGRNCYDFGVMHNFSESFVFSFWFDLSLLSEFLANRVEIEVSIYPTKEEDD